jgi:hypothetical protein
MEFNGYGRCTKDLSFAKSRRLNKDPGQASNMKLGPQNELGLSIREAVNRYSN